MAEKKIKICDDCEERIAVRNCFVCGADLCKGCSPDIKSEFAVYSEATKQKPSGEFRLREFQTQGNFQSVPNKLANQMLIQRQRQSPVRDVENVSSSRNKPIYLRIFNKPLYCCKSDIIKIKNIAIKNKGKIFQDDFGDRIEEEIKEKIKKALMLENLG